MNHLLTCNVMCVMCLSALVIQLNEELMQILNDDGSTNGFNVTSAPIILYLNSPHCDISSDKLAVSDDKLLKRVSVLPE